MEGDRKGRNEFEVLKLKNSTETTYLSDDGTEFTRCGRDTVSGRSVTSREDFSRNDESSSVGSKVLHKVGSAVLSRVKLSEDQ